MYLKMHFIKIQNCECLTEPSHVLCNLYNKDYMTRRILVRHSYLHSNKKTIFIYTSKKVFINESNLSVNMEIKTVDELCLWKENINTALAL